MKLSEIFMEKLLLIMSLVVTSIVVILPIVLTLNSGDMRILFWLFGLIPCLILILVSSAILVNKDNNEE